MTPRRTTRGRVVAVSSLSLIVTPARTFAHADTPETPDWTTWSWDPAVVIPLVLSLGLYALGLMRLWRGGHGRGAVRPWQAASFVAGWLALAIALVSPLHPIGRFVFWLHMTQHEILMLVAAPLLVLGHPLRPWIWSAPPAWRRTLGALPQRGGVRQCWQFVSHPLAAAIIHAIALWCWHVPRFFDATLTSEWVHAAQHASFLFTAVLFWWTVLRGTSGATTYGAGVLYLFATSMHSGLLGALITFAPTPLYPGYRHVTPSSGLTPLEDQQLGGLIMWIPASLIYVGAALGLFAAWLRPTPPRRTWQVVTTIGLLFALAPASGRAVPLAYVSNERDGTITVIETSTNRVVDTIQIGGRPRGIRAGPDRQHVYVAVSSPNGSAGRHLECIAVLDTTRNAITRRIAVGTDPEQFVIAPDGARLFVANEDVGTASIVDVGSGHRTHSLVVGIEPEGVGVSPDGRWVYVTAETSNTVSVIDTGQNRVVTNFFVDARPRDAIFSADGMRAYVTAEIGGSMSIVDVSTHTVIDTIAMPGGVAAVGVRVTPDGQRVYVANGRANTVTRIDVADGAMHTIAVGHRPWALEMSHDGSRLYAANGLSNTVSVIDVATDAVLTSIATGDGPWGIALLDTMAKP